jgi:hypothetical protein
VAHAREEFGNPEEEEHPPVEAVAKVLMKTKLTEKT